MLDITIDFALSICILLHSIVGSVVIFFVYRGLLQFLCTAVISTIISLDAVFAAAGVILVASIFDVVVAIYDGVVFTILPNYPFCVKGQLVSCCAFFAFLGL